MVENLQSSDTEEDVRKVFGKFGKLVEVRMGQTQAFVTFEDLYAAKDAVRGADGHNGTRAGNFKPSPFGFVGVSKFSCVCC